MVLTNAPLVTREPAQRSLTLDEVALTRYISPWSRPPILSAAQSRAWVESQQIAVICRETLIANFLSLDWAITARDTAQSDELKPTIRYYTKLLEHGGYNPNNFGMDYSGMMEWLLTDLLDINFGAGMEVGRRDDAPTGRVQWLKPLDGGTLYPTGNKDFPVVQMYSAERVVTFPAHALARMYMSPRTQILYEGWGMAPPERILRAILLLNRGDAYYANLLLDTPPAGILDLGDMEHEAALEWISAFKNMILGNPLDALKIPVLYEHTKPAAFIPFGRPPSEIAFDSTTLKYAAILAAGYGLSLSDIGMSTSANGGETLAGSIRQERKTRKGMSRLKKKVQFFFEDILPETLKFNIIDPDEEAAVNQSRARLGNATAWNLMVPLGMFSAKEARMQMIADGLTSIDLPEEPPKEAKDAAKQKQQAASLQKDPQRRPGLLGKPVPPSQGGQGEIKKSLSDLFGVEKSEHFESHLRRLTHELVTRFAPVLVESSRGMSQDDIFMLKGLVDDALFGGQDPLDVEPMIVDAWDGMDSLMKVTGDVKLLGGELAFAAEELVLEELAKGFAEQYEAGEIDDPNVPTDVLNSVLSRIHDVNYLDRAEELEANIQNNIQSFLGKSVLYNTKSAVLAEDVFDVGGVDSYDNVVNQVYTVMRSDFDRYAFGCVELEIENILNKIRMEIMGNG